MSDESKDNKEKSFSEKDEKAFDKKVTDDIQIDEQALADKNRKDKVEEQQNYKPRDDI